MRLSCRRSIKMPPRQAVQALLQYVTTTLRNMSDPGSAVISLYTYEHLPQSILSSGTKHRRSAH